MLGGRRVQKHDLRIDAYGTIDELNSFIGLIRSGTISHDQNNMLETIQTELFVIGSVLAADPDKPLKNAQFLPGESIQILEHEIDQMEINLSPLKHFILPGGSTDVSNCHIARCVCRRAERLVVALSLQTTIDETILIYLNRLSDYFFVLSRQLLLDNGLEEYKWIPR